jgi:FlaA1/EpsC-like NDP-sugar epimerase
MTQILAGQNAEIIFHAAAYKHVPLMERNVREAVSNNIFGLLALLDVARECGCRSFVAISSDKAVNPTSVMGCTKRIGELILAARPHGEMRCISVRFGNVLGSQGSVVPLFEEQIRKNGKVTVTHPDVTRFFMTISEAVSLVLQGFALGRHGELLVLEMGEPMRIVDMVRMLTRLLGKKDSDVEITYTGLRPGEKLYEELFYDSEVPLPTECGKVMRARGKLVSWDALRGSLDELRALISSSPDDATLRLKLSQIVPEYLCHQGLSPLGFAAAKPVRVAVQSNEPASVGNRETGRVSQLGALS